MYVNLGKQFRHYIDTETTGLDPTVHELLEVAVVTEEVDPLNPFRPGVTSRWSQKILPEHIENAEPKALEVNGYTPEKWDGAVPFSTIAVDLAKRLKGGVIVGQNVGFDVGFLNAAFKRAGVDHRMSYHHVDTVTLAYQRWGIGGEVQSLSLDKLRVFLGIPVAEHHSALKDAFDCRTVYYMATKPNLKHLWARLCAHYLYKMWDRLKLFMYFTS